VLLVYRDLKVSKGILEKEESRVTKEIWVIQVPRVIQVQLGCKVQLAPKGRKVQLDYEGQLVLTGQVFL
jgi:hypothetical protein